MVEEVEDKEVGRTLLVGMAATVLQFVVAGTILMRRSLLYAAADFKKMIFCSLPVTSCSLDFGFFSSNFWSKSRSI